MVWILNAGCLKIVSTKARGKALQYIHFETPQKYVYALAN